MSKLVTKRRAFVAIVIVAVIGVFAFTATRPDASSSRFFTAPAETGSLRNMVNATGVVQTVVTVQVGSQVSGQIEELYADFNSVVKRGQLLAKLDPRNFESQVQNSRANVAAAQARVRSVEAELKTQAANLLSSKANLEAARVTRDNTAVLFERASELAKSGVASKNDYDNAKANAESAQAKYEQAQAAVAQVEAQGHSAIAQLEQVKAQLLQAQADLDRSELNLEYCNIYSPVDGVVISRNVDVGQTIAASMQSPTLFTIANDLTSMQVNANVDEADIGNISDRADVRFTIDAYPNEAFRGRISEIRLNPQTVQNVVTYNVMIDIENPEMKLKPGMTANISITVDQRDGALKVPNAGLRYTPPGVQRADLMTEAGGEPIDMPQKAAPEAQAKPKREFRQAQLAPGQKWDPSEKIRTAVTREIVHRPGLVYVLNAGQMPEPRRVMLGITDGSTTEVVSGDLKEGELVIIGDTTQAAGPPATSSGPPFSLGFRGMGGGRGN